MNLSEFSGLARRTTWQFNDHVSKVKEAFQVRGIWLWPKASRRIGATKLVLPLHTFWHCILTHSCAEKAWRISTTKLLQPFTNLTTMHTHTRLHWEGLKKDWQHQTTTALDTPYDNASRFQIHIRSVVAWVTRGCVFPLCTKVEVSVLLAQQATSVSGITSRLPLGMLGHWKTMEG